MTAMRIEPGPTASELRRRALAATETTVKQAINDWPESGGTLSLADVRRSADEIASRPLRPPDDWIGCATCGRTAEYRTEHGKYECQDGHLTPERSWSHE